MPQIKVKAVRLEHYDEMSGWGESGEQADSPIEEGSFANLDLTGTISVQGFYDDPPNLFENLAADPPRRCVFVTSYAADLWARLSWAMNGLWLRFFDKPMPVQRFGRWETKTRSFDVTSANWGEDCESDFLTLELTGFPDQDASARDGAVGGVGANT